MLQHKKLHQNENTQNPNRTSAKKSFLFVFWNDRLLKARRLLQRKGVDSKAYGSREGLIRSRRLRKKSWEEFCLIGEFGKKKMHLSLDWWQFLRKTSGATMPSRTKPMDPNLGVIDDSKKPKPMGGGSNSPAASGIIYGATGNQGYAQAASQDDWSKDVQF